MKRIVDTGIPSDGSIMNIDDLVLNPPCVQGFGDGPDECRAVNVEPLRMSPEEKSKDVELSLALLYQYISNKIQLVVRDRL